MILAVSLFWLVITAFGWAILRVISGMMWGVGRVITVIIEIIRILLGVFMTFFSAAYFYITLKNVFKLSNTGAFFQNWGSYLKQNPTKTLGLLLTAFVIIAGGDMIADGMLSIRNSMDRS